MGKNNLIVEFRDHVGVDIDEVVDSIKEIAQKTGDLFDGRRSLVYNAASSVDAVTRKHNLDALKSGLKDSGFIRVVNVSVPVDTPADSPFPDLARARVGSAADSVCVEIGPDPMNTTMVGMEKAIFIKTDCNEDELNRGIKDIKNAAHAVKARSMSRREGGAVLRDVMKLLEEENIDANVLQEIARSVKAAYGRTNADGTIRKAIAEALKAGDAAGVHSSNAIMRLQKCAAAIEEHDCDKQQSVEDIKTLLGHVNKVMVYARDLQGQSQSLTVVKWAKYLYLSAKELLCRALGSLTAGGYKAVLERMPVKPEPRKTYEYKDLAEALRFVSAGEGECGDIGEPHDGENDEEYKARCNQKAVLAECKATLHKLVDSPDARVVGAAANRVDDSSPNRRDNDYSKCIGATVLIAGKCSQGDATPEDLQGLRCCVNHLDNLRSLAEIACQRDALGLDLKGSNRIHDAVNAGAHKTGEILLDARAKLVAESRSRDSQ